MHEEFHLSFEDEKYFCKDYGNQPDVRYIVFESLGKDLFEEKYIFYNFIIPQKD